MLSGRQVLVITLGVSALLMAMAPRLALNPGPVSAGHASIERRCTTCHVLLRGTPARSCLTCHPSDSIGLARSQAPEAALPRPALAALHRSIGERSCVACHSDHRGRDPSSATPRFSHQELEPALRAGCGDCHASIRPDDVLHADTGPDCGTCHQVSGWTPASFAHDQYFVLDRDHTAPCRTCHPPGESYRTYTCYGCHAHTPTATQAEHREEGLVAIRDCVRCHRSAQEHEGGGEHRGGRDNEDD